MPRYVFDIDGTLCSTVPGNYREARPLLHRIAKVNELYESGNYIVLFTARGMMSSRGIRFLAQIRWRRITSRQLRRWGVKYHRLILGKPSGDFYIDDKGFSAEVFFGDLL